MKHEAAREVPWAVVFAHCLCLSISSLLSADLRTLDWLSSRVCTGRLSVHPSDLLCASPCSEQTRTLLEFERV